MAGILSLGEMVIDFLPGQEAGSYIRKPGGAPANVAVAASRNGVPAGFCGRMGDDDFGRFLVNVLKENGVQVLCPEPVQEAIVEENVETEQPAVAEAVEAVEAEAVEAEVVEAETVETAETEQTEEAAQAE